MNNAKDRDQQYLQTDSQLHSAASPTRSPNPFPSMKPTQSDTPTARTDEIDAETDANRSALDSYFTMRDFARQLERELQQANTDNTSLAGRLTAAELERDRLGSELATLHARVAELAEALEALQDEQNGPPLVQREKHWNAAMEQADAALARHRAK